MKRWLVAGTVLGVMFGAMFWANPASATSIQTCPVLTAGYSDTEGVASTYISDQTGQANEGCNVFITFGPGGSVTTTFPNGAGYYDTGGDDNLVGIYNNSGSTISSIYLSSTTYDIMGFDGDGVCGTASGNASPSNSYGGYTGYTYLSGTPNDNSYACPNPLIAGNITSNDYFPVGITVSPVSDYAGTVYFTGGLPSGDYAWFSLEGPVDINLSASAVVPEPGTLSLLGTGILGLVGVIGRQRRKIA